MATAISDADAADPDGDAIPEADNNVADECGAPADHAQAGHTTKVRPRTSGTPKVEPQWWRRSAQPKVEHSYPT